jgi:hypothetical protein
VVEGDKPVSEYEFVAELPICVPFLKILYPETPTLSVEAVQERLTWFEEIAVAVRLAGTVGAWVSGGPSFRNGWG